MLDRFLEFFLRSPGWGARPGGGILLNSQTQSNTRFFRVGGGNAMKARDFASSGHSPPRCGSPFARLASGANGRDGE
jgi:hypothetical protein